MSARTFEAAFPDGKNTPAISEQGRSRSLVALTVPADLIGPEFLSRFRHLEQRAIMSMPKATVDQNGGAITRKNYVRAAGQVWRVQSKPKTCRMQTTAKKQFRLSVPAADAAHIAMPLFGCEDIHSGDRRRRIGDDKPERRHDLRLRHPRTQ